jgi:hypothetical protein
MAARMWSHARAPFTSAVAKLGVSLFLLGKPAGNIGVWENHAMQGRMAGSSGRSQAFALRKLKMEGWSFRIL